MNRSTVSRELLGLFTQEEHDKSTDKGTPDSASYGSSSDGTSFVRAGGGSRATGGVAIDVERCLRDLIYFYEYPSVEDISHTYRMRRRASQRCS